METAPHNPAPPRRHPVADRWRHFLHTVVVVTIITAVAGVGCRAITAHLTINLTTSMPRGLYWLRPSVPLSHGTAVYLEVPSSIRGLVAERRYLPPNFHLLKRVVALAGDRVCTDNHRYVVDDQLLSVIASRDRTGRPLTPFSYCAIVRPGVAFVAADGESSLDSRYFGPVSLEDLTPAVPLWTSF
jgi:conjugative transfer signal peptidase TraF